MAGTSPAGTVSVSIIGEDDNFQQAMQKINQSIQRFQKQVAATKMPGFQNGMATFRDWSITAAATGHLLHRAFSVVSSAVRTAITDMATFGDTYAKMSRRVGMGAKDLSLLGYAAEQSGASVSALGDGMKFLNRNLALAGQGSKAAQDAFAAIGINPNRLQALDKKEQFLQVADAIRRLGDEAKQTDAAMKIFGRGGTSMLPMFQAGSGGIQGLMKEADDLGLGISDEDAAKAEILSSSITRLQRSMQGLRRSIVSGLVEPVTKFLDWGTKVIKNLREWTAANQNIIKTIFKVGKAVLIIGAAFATWRFVAPLFVGITKTVSGLTLAILKMSAAVLLSPWGLMAVAIAGATAALLYFTGAGSKLMSWFGDITAMIQEGRIVDAVKVMWLEILLLFEEGKLAIMNRWHEVAVAISAPFMDIYDAVSSAVKPVVDYLVDAFHGLGDWIADQFGGPMQWLCDMFGQWWSYIKGGWDTLMNDIGAYIVGYWWLTATGVNEAIAFIRNAWNDMLSGIQTFILVWAKAIIATFDRVVRAVDFTGYVSSATSAAIAEIDKMIKGVESRGIQAGLNIETDKKEWQDYLDKMASDALDKADNTPQTTNRIEGLKREIAELKKPINKPGEKSQQITETAQRISQQGASAITQGTMNKADILGGALAYMASEKDHSEDIADNTSKANDLLTELNRNVKNGAMRYA